MANSTTVTSKGQVTIPKQMRERNAITPGTRLEVIEREGEIVLRKARKSKRGKASDPEFEEYLQRVGGTLDLGMSTDEYMELLRGE